MKTRRFVRVSLVIALVGVAGFVGAQSRDQLGTVDLPSLRRIQFRQHGSTRIRRDRRNRAGARTKTETVQREGCQDARVERHGTSVVAVQSAVQGCCRKLGRLWDAKAECRMTAVFRLASVNCRFAAPWRKSNAAK